MWNVQQPVSVPAALVSVPVSEDSELVNLLLNPQTSNDKVSGSMNLLIDSALSANAFRLLVPLISMTGRFCALRVSLGL